jgi:transposase InsO family protein
MARREAEDLLRRSRRVAQRRRRRLMRALHWARPNTVWAADFSAPPRPVEGCFGRLLAVRDLASGVQLLWLPAADESSPTACAALVALFREHGAPLVLKSDNGSAFASAEFRELLADWQVRHLFSPPRTPSYNGSCEAGIGSMKARTHHQASRAGRPGEWTCDDAEAARLEANGAAHPWGARGPTPEEAWLGRRPLEPGERLAFAQAFRAKERLTRQEQGYAPEASLDRTAQAAVDRVALRRALVTCGLLTVTSAHLTGRR